MFKKFSVLFFVFVSVPALANNPYAGACSDGTMSDNFGRGIQAEVEGNTADLITSMWPHRSCYDLGRSFARGQIAQSASERRCKSQFADGRKQGLEMSATGNWVGCFGLGYAAGQAALRVGAREADTSLAPRRCVELYKKGVRDYQPMIAVNNPGESNQLDYCYRMGWWEAPYRRR